MKKLISAALIAATIIAILYIENSKPEIYNIPEGEQMSPELTKIAGWINTGPIKISDFKGKVVLIDFWTYTCINCIRTLPYITDWDRKYRDKGLVIIGVHTPEFEFEKDYSNVLKAVQKHDIKYSVAQDNDYATWKAFNNHYWPAKYLINKDGKIVYNHFGEGAYEETEKKIQELLSEINEVPETGLSYFEPEASYGLPQTPELYAGYSLARQQLGNDEGYKPGITIDYKLLGSLKNNLIYLEGEWQNNADNLRHAGSKAGSINLKFTARTVNIVAFPAGSNAEAEILVNGKYLTKNIAGKDVQFEGKRSFIAVDHSDIYNILGLDNEYGTYTLKIIVKSDSFAWNAFTFGS